MLRFKNGMVMQLQVCWSAAHTPGWMLEAFGSKGRFVSRADFPDCARHDTASRLHWWRI